LISNALKVIVPYPSWLTKFGLAFKGLALLGGDDDLFRAFGEFESLD